MAEAKKSNSKDNGGKTIAIVVAVVVAVVGVVVAILFATGVLGGPKMAGTYTLTGMKQGDQDMSSLLGLLTSGGGEMSLEMKDNGTCVMKTKGAEITENEVYEESDDGVTVDSEVTAEPTEEVTPCTYDAKKKTITVNGETTNFTYEKDTISFESDGLTMIYTRKK